MAGLSSRLIYGLSGNNWGDWKGSERFMDISDWCQEKKARPGSKQGHGTLWDTWSGSIHKQRTLLLVFVKDKSPSVCVLWQTGPNNVLVIKSERCDTSCEPPTGSRHRCQREDSQALWTAPVPLTCPRSGPRTEAQRWTLVLCSRQEAASWNWRTAGLYTAHVAVKTFPRKKSRFH